MNNSSQNTDFASFFAYADHLKSSQTRLTSSSQSVINPTQASPIASHAHSITQKDGQGDQVIDLYPQGPANVRFQEWSSPFARRRLSTLHEIVSPDEASDFFKVMIASLDPGTRDSYAGGLKRFISWCDARQIPDEHRMPVSADTLALFLSSEGRGLSNSTHNNWLAGIRFWHTIHGAEWHGNDHIVTQLRKGLKKTSIPPKRAKRPPVTLEHMESLHARLDLNSPKDAAVWAVAAIAFWSVCRLGELTYPDKGPFTEEKYARRSSPLAFSRTRPTEANIDGTEFASLSIPWSKTSKFDGAVISITARPGSPLCPIAALRNHLRVNSDLPSSAPFFSYADNSDENGFLNLTRVGVMARANAIWVSTGLPSMKGHGFRIGGATHLLLTGTPPQVVEAQGRWTSRAFMDYWREVQIVIPVFISQHNTSDAFVRLSSSMDSYSASRSRSSSSRRS